LCALWGGGRATRGPQGVLQKGGEKFEGGKGRRKKEGEERASIPHLNISFVIFSREKKKDAARKEKSYQGKKKKKEKERGGDLRSAST